MMKAPDRHDTRPKPGSDKWIQEQRERMWMLYQANDLEHAAMVASVILASE